MNGSMREKRPGYWELRAWAGHDPVTGRRRQLSRTVQGGKREAQRALAGFVSEVSRGETVATPRVTLAQAMERWLEHQSTKDRGAGTLRGYRQITMAVAAAPVGTVPLARLKAEQIEAFYAQLTAAGRAANTVARYHAAIRGALNLAVFRRWITHNPAIGTARPSARRPELTVPTPDQVLAILAAADARAPEHGAFLRLAAATSARRGELVGLRRSEVNLIAGEVLIATSMSAHGGLKDTKSHSKRLISIDSDTVDVLADHYRKMEKRAGAGGHKLAAAPFVFSDELDCHRAWHPDTATRFFDSAARRAKVVGVRLHDLRHFGATQQLASGVPITTVSHRLGHAKVTTTLDIYAHWIPSTDQLASSLMGVLLKAPPALPPG